MEMLRNMVRFFKNKLIIIISFVITIIYIGLYIFITVTSFKDATWIYSASMQTLATLIALLPISYGYYVQNLDNERNEDFDSYIINRLKRDVYYDMMTVIFFALFVILINLISFFITEQGFYSFLIAYLTTLSVGHITIYIYRLFDPNKVSEILKEYDVGKIEPGQKLITLDQFITDYLELESKVKDFITSQNDSELLANMPLYDIVDVYSKDYPEIEQNYDRFKEIIFHRNNVIHNYSDVQVDYQKYQSLLELKSLFQKYNFTFIQNNIFTNVLNVKNLIEDALKEFHLTENSSLNVDEEVKALLRSYFISDYYECVSEDSDLDVDVEIVQNNFSSFKIVGIEIKQIGSKNIFHIAESFFERFQERYLYLFVIFYNTDTKTFVVLYQNQDKSTKRFMVSYKGSD